MDDRELQDSLAASTEMAEEKLSNIRTVRAFAMETKEMDNYKVGLFKSEMLIITVLLRLL